MSAPTKTWVTFAVKEEAGPFRKRLPAGAPVRVLLTGMGKRNAERAVRAALERERPGLVVSSGFAGGLNPAWSTGTVLYDGTAPQELAERLEAAGAKRGRFCCVDRVAATASEKKLLFEKTGADAVEMESEEIGAVCREKQVPCVTVRVVLDTAGEDLPLDFNQVLTEDQRLDFTRLAVALAKSPGKIPALAGLRRQSAASAARLAEVLAAVVAGLPGA